MRRFKQGMHEDSNKDALQLIDLNIVDYLMKNVYMQNKIEFYLSLDPKTLQKLLSIAFQPDQLNHQGRLFVVNLLKKYTFILNIAFNNEHLCFEKLFLFLRCEHFEYELLNAFEDIYLPFCKKFAQKVLQVQAGSSQCWFRIANIYYKQIFKIMYTAVFCCELAYQQATKDISEHIMKHLVNSVFQFSPYPLPKHTHRNHLEYGQVTFSLKEFLSDLTINLATVELNLVHELIKLIDQAFIENILTHFNALRQKQVYEQYCEGAIYILINILRLLQTFKLCIHTQHGQKDKVNQYQVERLLCQSAVFISSKLNKFMEFFLQENNKSLNFSSGERIESVGLLKYSVLELIQKILSINQIQNLSIQFEAFDFFLIVQVFLQRYRWNNILHNLIFKITQHILSQDYAHFKKRYLQQVPNYNKSLFGSLIMHFRNRKFIFLHSMHMIGQGHQNFIFRISKILINEMQQKNDLNGLIESFKIWKHFMQVDLKEYQIKNYQLSHCFDLNTEEKPDPKSNSKYNSLNTPTDIHFHSNKPLQTIQQILKHFNEQQKWSPKHSPSQIRKSQLLNNEIIQKIDSLAIYQPLKQ